MWRIQICLQSNKMLFKLNFVYKEKLDCFQGEKQNNLEANENNIEANENNIEVNENNIEVNKNNLEANQNNSFILSPAINLI